MRSAAFWSDFGIENISLQSIAKEFCLKNHERIEFGLFEIKGGFLHSIAHKIEILLR